MLAAAEPSVPMRFTAPVAFSTRYTAGPARKYSVPLTSVRCDGADEVLPVATSAARTVPSGVPSVFHNSTAVVPVGRGEVQAFRC